MCLPCERRRKESEGVAGGGAVVVVEVGDGCTVHISTQGDDGMPPRRGVLWWGLVYVFVGMSPLDPMRSMRVEY